MIVDAARQFPLDKWTKDAYSDFQRILDAIKELDRKLDQKDCEDPAKQAWMREVEERLKKLEGK